MTISQIILAIGYIFIIVYNDNNMATNAQKCQQCLHLGMYQLDYQRATKSEQKIDAIHMLVCSERSIDTDTDS